MLDKIFYYNSVIHIIDDTEVEIENCRKIEECDEIFVKLRTRNLVIKIWGNNLKLDDFNAEGVRVKGRITSVELESARRKAEKI
jgi:sporulation protein YqfC